MSDPNKDVYEYVYDNLNPKNKKIIDSNEYDKKSVIYGVIKILKGNIFLLNHTNKVVNDHTTISGASATLNVVSGDVEAGNVIDRDDHTVWSCYAVKNSDDKKILSEWHTNPSEQLQVEHVDDFIAEKKMMN
ncbi:hypothetical protein CHS0354_009785 [Potamilus streckersoni]|uniref:Uncharacterized protein n=1 Tax=Potamilus streckersoni TaxID=2493646 RepID=A0AAE0W367_9BIVA|nr:hypothetical protein CHS0354_009785 [Potamilus streckersoni]